MENLATVQPLENLKTYCPYCGEAIDLVIDCSVIEQHYIEDCQVCCRPISVSIRIDSDNNASVAVRHENET